MTKPEAIERAKRQLGAGPEFEVDLGAMVMQASAAVAHKVMRDSAIRGLLQQEYSVTLDANGEGNLLTATGSVTSAAGEILLEGVHFGAVLDANGLKLQPLFHYSEFVAPQMTVFGYYHIKDKATILTRARGVAVSTASDIQSANGPLTITASYDPASVDDFPSELEDLLVQELVNLAATKVAPAK